MTSLNLNGKLWATGDNIGKQLIQKLGWTEGEGLGKNKQGSVSHVKVSLKNDRDGIGMKSDKFSNNSGLLRTVDYDMLLKSKYAEVSGKKVEEPIERSMSRPKFGRAVKQDYFKPINNDDWTKITGKLDDNNCNGDIKITTNNAEVMKTSSLLNNCDTESDLKFITKKLNVNEYFEMQMKIKMAKLQNVTLDDNFSNNILSVESPQKSEVELSYLDSDSCKAKHDKKEERKKKRSTMLLENDIEGPKKKLQKVSDSDNEQLTKKSKKNKSIEIVANIESDFTTEMVLKKSKKKERRNVSVNLDQEIEESKSKLLEIANLLGNEPERIIIENDREISCKAKEVCVKVEEVISRVNLKVEEMASLLLSSPLDTSNIRDIKGYKYY